MTTNMRSTPIDLMAEFGDKYRIDSEETRVHGGKWDPWLAQIRCRYGHIYVYGDEELGVSVDSGRVKIAGTIRKLSCVRVVQDGDDGELNGVFHRDDLIEVLKIMQPYRRKQFSEETLQRFRENLGKVNASRLSREEGSSRRETAVSA